MSLFQTFDQQFAPAIQSGVSSVISSGLSAVAPELASLLTLYVIIQGMMIMFGQYDMWRGVTAIARAAIIGLLLTASYFASYIQTPITHTIPTFLANATGQPSITGLAQFDALESAVEHFAAGIIAQSSGFSGIATRIEVGILVLACIAFIAIGALIWELTTGFLNLVVCLGPFVLLAYLFASTRGITERWIGKIIGLLMLYLLITILEQLVLGVESYFVRQTQMNPGAGIDAQVAAMVEMVVFFMMGAAMLVFIPGIAAYIGGGVHSNVVGLALAPMRRLGLRR